MVEYWSSKPPVKGSSPFSPVIYGKGGIWTHGIESQYNDLANRRFRPLSHLS